MYDLNGDGFIDLEEMTSYLTAVFRMLYQLQPGTAEQMGVSMEELGIATGRQAFEDADLNHDGRISFDEFRQFYLASNGITTTAEKGDSSADMSLNVAKQLTCLHHYHIEDVFLNLLFAQMRMDYSIERISRRASHSLFSPQGP